MLTKHSLSINMAMFEKHLRKFTAEMETIGKIKHRNLVPLLGYCRTEAERLLVYQYMEGGSLHDWLHGNEQQTKMNPI